MHNKRVIFNTSNRMGENRVRESEREGKRKREREKKKKREEQMEEWERYRIEIHRKKKRSKEQWANNHILSNALNRFIPCHRLDPPWIFIVICADIVVEVTIVKLHDKKNANADRVIPIKWICVVLKLRKKAK